MAIDFNPTTKIDFKPIDFKPTTPLQTPQSPPQQSLSFTQKLAGGVKPFISSALQGGAALGEMTGMGELGRGIAGSIFQYTPEGKQSLKSLSTGKISQKQYEDITKPIMPSNKEVLGSAAQTALNIGTAGLPATNTAATATGRILTTAGVSGAIGSLYGAAEGLKKEGNWSETLKNMVSSAGKSGATGMVIGGALQSGVEALRAIPKLLSYTSATPEGALQRQFDVPNPTKPSAEPYTTTSENVNKPIFQSYSSEKAKGASATLREQPKLGTPEEISNYAKGIVKDLRKQMSAEYQATSDYISQSYQGKTFSVNESDLNLLAKVEDDFGINVPKNIDKMSYDDGMNLLKQVNELYDKKAVRESAQGIPVKKLHDSLRSALVDNFGGKQGATDEMLKNYSAKMQVFNNINDVVGAYKDRPTQINTYQSRLMSIFKENKPAYLDAVMDLEKLTGKNLQDSIARYATSSYIPPLSGKFGYDEIFRLLFTPFTSPGIAGLSSRWAGRITQMTQTQFANYLRNIISGQVSKNN